MTRRKGGGVEPSITNSALNALTDVGEHFEQEARKCAEGGSFQAACIMAVAHFEAWLLATAGFLEVELRREGYWPLRHKHADALLQWDLETSIQLARRAGWFEGGPLPASQLEEAVRSCQQLRNACAHPGRYVRDGGLVGEDDFVAVYNLIDHALGVLGEVLNRAADPPIGAS